MAINKNDLDLAKMLCSMNQKTVANMMDTYLRDIYKKVITTKKYIYAKGDIPVAIVAHMDTVFSYKIDNFFYDPERMALWTPDGLGADDRAGIFAIIKILGSGMRPHIILTTGEEMGGVGALELVKRKKKPFAPMKYIIELDRSGYNDCVFYECGNKKFQQYIEGFGFKTAIGSFSDISFICPEWDVAGVNLSIGYYFEHSESELWMLEQTYDTISIVIDMLKHIDEAEFYKYENNVQLGWFGCHPDEIWEDTYGEGYSGEGECSKNYSDSFWF